MGEQTTRDEKLVQYLNEAHAKEKELETALGAHVEMTNRASYKKRLRQHLKETKSHAKQVERRIKKLGGDTSKLSSGAGMARSAAKGPLQALRGKGEEETLLKNAKSEYSEEAEEIATYTAIEALAEAVGDKETAKVARQIRREEERMANFIAKQIPILSRAVAQSEIPASERNGGSARRRSSRSSSTRGSSSRRASSGSRSSSSSRRGASGGRSSSSSGRASSGGGSSKGSARSSRGRSRGRSGRS